MIKHKNVLLLKSKVGEASDDNYGKLLKSHGFGVSLVQTLTFNFTNIDNLRIKLEKSHDYQGIIFTSPRCVQAVSLAVGEDKKILQNWKEKHNFTTGESTYKDAMENLGLECKGKESGNSANLSKLILEEKSSYNKPFLLPHGSLKTDGLANIEQEGITVEKVLVYDTIANPSIESEIANATDNFTTIPEYLVFFSPSGVQSAIDYLRRVTSDFTNVKLIAIGPTTESAIKKENCKVFAVSKQPKPEEVLKLLK